MSKYIFNKKIRNFSSLFHLWPPGIKFSFKYLCTRPQSSSTLHSEEENVNEKTNPLFIKYKKMISNISKNTDLNEEIVYGTNFGHVRFDSDNKIHLERDREKMKLTTESCTVLKQDHDENREKDMYKDGDLNLNFIDETYFEETLSHLRDTNAESVTETKNLSKINPTSKDYLSNLNDIDSQYFNFEANDTPMNVKVSNMNLVDESYDDFQNLDHQSNKNVTDVIPSNYENKYSETLNTCSYNTDQHFSFEDSIMENSDFNHSIPSKSNKISFPRRESTDREILENQLLELSDRASQTLFHSNPQLKKTKELEKDESEALPEIEPSVSNTQDNPESLSLKREEFKVLKSAYAFVQEKRKEEFQSSIKELKNEILPHQRYKKVLIQLPQHSQRTEFEMIKYLKNSVIYNQDDIVALFKPYGIPLHGGGGNSKNHRWKIVDLLPHLADAIKEAKLLPVHRLDMNTTGILLLSKTDEMAAKLKEMFKKNLIKKSYLAVVKGNPSPSNGIIDIPIGRGKVEQYERMVLFPDVPGLRARNKHAKKAMTRYKVLSQSNGCALLELNPITGIKHQVRVHLGFGLNCPVLGDHKYSYLTKMAPQKLPGDALERFGLKQSAVRHLPLHLHSFGVNIPGVAPGGGGTSIQTGPPKFFKETLRALKLSSRKNRVTTEYSDTIYGYE